MHFGGLLTYLGSCAIVCGGIWGIFEKIDKVANDEFKSRVTLWIKDLDLSGAPSNSKAVIYGFFAKFFGEKHFSLKCLVHCTLYSLFIFVSIIIISNVFSHSLSFMQLVVAIKDAYTILIFMIFQDYFALLKTRLLLKLHKNERINNLLALLLIDLFSTILIAFIGYAIVYYASGENNNQDNSILSSFMEMYGPYRDRSFFGAITNYIRPFFQTIILGALWIIMIPLAGFLTRIFSEVFKYFNLFRSIIDIENKPINSLSAMLIITITAVYIIGIPFVFFF